MIDARRVRNFYVLCSLVLLAACSNGRGSLDANQQPPPPPPPSGGAQEGFTVGGTISGLQGDGLVLQNNGGSNLAVANDGTFTFTGELADAAAYNVTVLTQPAGPSQTCTVGNANGTIAGANITNVAVTCATGAFALRGTVSGLRGSGLVLQNNGADDLLIITNGEFSFPVPYASGSDYNVTVRTPPSGPSQSCTVANASGTIGSADVADLKVSCATGTFAIGVTVSGLAGSGLVLRNNERDELRVSGNGTFQFRELLASGATYDVRVATAPTNPTQSCAVEHGSGLVGASNVTNIAVTCMTSSFTVGGSIAGLSGSGLQLRLNNGKPLEVLARATNFTFAALLPSGTNYVVHISHNPSNPAQTCEFAPNTDVGTVGTANVTSVAITCTTRVFSIGGTVRGLEGRGLMLQKNGGDDRAVASDGEYTFQTKQASGTNYDVKVSAPPANPSQTCSIAHASGTVRDGDINNVDVTCATDSFRVGGTVIGLLGSGLVLINNGGDDLSVPFDGSFQFATPVASSANYNVSVRTPPGNPTQACEVSSGSGTVGTSDVTGVVVNCSTSSFTIGGSVTGLAGSGLVLRNNGGDDLRLDSGANSFTFQTPVSSGAQYGVTVAAQPTGPTQECTVVPGTESGTVAGANITAVEVSCVTTEFSVGGTVTGVHGTGLQLLNNGSDAVAIAADGPFKFPTSLPNGAPFNVTVSQQPSAPAQICAVNPAAGSINGADVTSIEVGCIDSSP